MSDRMDDTSTLVPLIGTYTILIASGIYWFYFRKEKLNDDSQTKQSSLSSTSTSTSSTTKPKQQQQTSQTSQTSQQRLKNVWDAPRNQTSQQKTTHSNDKPFGSSYYYAHNNPNAKGGYKDGLKMEDYTMNGPRLLAKGGTPVTITTIEQEEKKGMTTDEALSESVICWEA